MFSFERERSACMNRGGAERQRGTESPKPALCWEQKSWPEPKSEVDQLNHLGAQKITSLIYKGQKPKETFTVKDK